MSGILSRSPDMKSGIVGGFPTGSVLQVLSDNYNSQTEASSEIKVCEVSMTMRQANSKFYYQAQMALAGYGDADNSYVTVTRSTGTASNTDYLPADNRGPGTQGGLQGYQVYSDDMGVVPTNSLFTFTASDLVLDTHAAGLVIIFALYIAGGCYINRSLTRADTETGITSLTIFEIGV